jgi:hypothetical protein
VSRDYFAHARSDVRNYACLMNPAPTNCWMTGWCRVHRLNLLHPTRSYFFERFLGTLAPFFRASERPIAIACFLLLTFLPDLPLLSVPVLRFFMARPTFFAAPLEYFPFFAIALIPEVSGTSKSELSVRPKVHFFCEMKRNRTIENKVSAAVF